MKEVNLNRQVISRAIWHRILSNAQMLEPYRAELIAEAQDLERQRVKAAYNTGSISASSVWVLAATAYYFEPGTIAEVGTFIGRSAYAMSEGCLHAFAQPVIYTCDASNDIDLSELRQFKHDAELVQFPKQTSTQMFQKLAADGIKVDWVHVDGRLSHEDVDLIKKISHNHTLITLDDMEGVEKGYANTAALFKELGALTHLLVYPPEFELLQGYGLKDSCTMGMLLPRTLFKLTAQ